MKSFLSILLPVSTPWQPLFLLLSSPRVLWCTHILESTHMILLLFFSLLPPSAPHKRVKSALAENDWHCVLQFVIMTCHEGTRLGCPLVQLSSGFPPWGSLGFFDLWVYSFHHTWKNQPLFLQIFSLCSPYSFRDPCYTPIFLPTTLQPHSE